MDTDLIGRSTPARKITGFESPVAASNAKVTCRSCTWNGVPSAPTVYIAVGRASTAEDDPHLRAGGPHVGGKLVSATVDPLRGSADDHVGHGSLSLIACPPGKSKWTL